MSPSDEIAGETTAGNHLVTNYPPYSCWRSEQTADFEAALDSPPPPGPLGLYVHIPFCEQRCAYCYFRVYPLRKPEVVDRYIDAVLQELLLYRDRPATAGRPLRCVYFGGGSPSYLSVEQIRRLIRGLRDALPWDGVEEFVFECDPFNTTLEKLATAAELGATRVSLGFQTLNTKSIITLGRASEREHCFESYRAARAAGVGQVNIDTLAGLPGETEETFFGSLDEIIELAPDCVTVCQLDLTHNSRLHRTMKFRRIDLPSWPEKRAWVAGAFERLEAAGYTVINAYMCARDPAAYTPVYTVHHTWHGGDVLALGETGVGHLQGFHYQNADSQEKYIAALDEYRLPLRRALRLTNEEKLRREVILQLKTGRLDAEYFRAKFDAAIGELFATQLDELEREGFAGPDGDSVRLTRAGLVAVDWLLPRFFLPQHAGVRYT